MLDADGAPIAAPARFALCRCGNSSRKPFCDGTHAKVAFDGSRLRLQSDEPAEDYRARRITIHDDRSICAHAGVCTDNLPGVFRMGKEPWIDARAAPLEEVIAIVKRCPSGALSYSLDGALQAGASREPAITVSKDGPYLVDGDVELRTAGVGPRCADRYALCRCGGSLNKPYCDGTHWRIAFDGSRARQRGALAPAPGMALLGRTAGALIVAGVALALLALEAAGKRTAPGFLGPGGLFPDLNLALELLLVAGLTFGAWLARRGNITAHRYNQTTWVLVNAVLVALIMARSLENAPASSMSAFAQPHVWMPWLHAAIGAATTASGLWLVLQMNDLLPTRLRVRGWKTMMRLTLAGYWVVAVMGLATYYVWYL